MTGQRDSQAEEEEDAQEHLLNSISWQIANREHAERPRPKSSDWRSKVDKEKIADLVSRTEKLTDTEA